MSCAEIWRKCVPGRGTSRSEGSEAGLCMKYLRKRKRGSVVGVTWVRDRHVVGGQISRELTETEFITTRISDVSMATDSHKTLELVRMLCCTTQASYSGYSYLATRVLAAEGPVFLQELLSAERSGLLPGHVHFTPPYPIKDMVQRLNPFASIQGDSEGHPSCRVPMGPAEASVATASQLSSSCPTLLPPLPSMLIQQSLLLTNLHLRACALGNPT